MFSILEIMNYKFGNVQVMKLTKLVIIKLSIFGITGVEDNETEKKVLFRSVSYIDETQLFRCILFFLLLIEN